jgi:tetratricopeptide (TPR) repeat protein
MACMNSHDHGRWLPVTTTSEEARARFERGRSAAHHYQFAEACEHLDAALAADPTFVLALLHRGGSADDPDEVRAWLDQAEANRERATDDEGLMIDAFRAFLLAGDYHRAVAILHDLSARYDADPYLPNYLGLRYYRNLKRYDDAVAQFEDALARDPGFTQAYNWLGYVAMDRGDHATAASMFERYLALAPDQPRSHDSMGVLCLRSGRYEEAMRHFEQALARDARFDESREKLLRAREARTQELAEAAPERSGTGS